MDFRGSKNGVGPRQFCRDCRFLRGPFAAKPFGKRILGSAAGVVPHHFVEIWWIHVVEAGVAPYHFVEIWWAHFVESRVAPYHFVEIWWTRFFSMVDFYKI